MNTPELILCELAPTDLTSHQSYSPFCLKAHRALRAAGLPYTSRHADRPDAHKLSPTDQVPVLLVDGRVVADSTHILEEVLALAPGRLDARPEAWLWEELADTALNGFVVAARWADDDNWPRTRQAYFGGIPAPLRGLIGRKLRAGVLRTLVARDVWRAGPAACWARLERLLEQLEARAPERDYWCGPALSVADVALFAQLHSLRTALTPGQAEAVARRPRLTAWLERVDAVTGTAAAAAPRVQAA
jgi:glutathione S-transferase